MYSGISSPSPLIPRLYGTKIIKLCFLIRFKNTNVYTYWQLIQHCLRLCVFPRRTRTWTQSVGNWSVYVGLLCCGSWDILLLMNYYHYQCFVCIRGKNAHTHTDCNLDDRSYTQTWAHLQVVNGECDEYRRENEFNNNIKKDSRFYGSLHYSVRLICVRVYVFCVYFTASIPLELTIFLVLQFKNYTQSYNLFDAYKMRISFKSDYKKTFNLTKALVAANCVIDSSIKMWNCIKKIFVHNTTNYIALRKALRKHMDYFQAVQNKKNAVN